MKKKIIIISAIAVAVIGVIVGTIALLVSSFLVDTENPDVSTITGTAVITLGDDEGEKGDTVKIPVDVSENGGFMASLLNFSYDSSALKYIGYEKGDVLTDYEFSEGDGSLKFLGLENEDVTATGTLFTLKFEILTDSKQETEIKLDVEDIINYDEQSLTTTVENGKVTVK